MGDECFTVMELVLDLLIFFYGNIKAFLHYILNFKHIKEVLMKVLHAIRKEIKKAKRPISFTMAMIMAGMSFFPYAPGTITSFAALNESQQQGLTPQTNPDGTIPNGNKPQDRYETARVYVNNTPIRLEVSKIKTPVDDHEGIAPINTEAKQENTITYKLSGRVEGAAAELLQKYGTENIELAYAKNGNYLGYGWKRGTLEYMQYRSEHLEEFGDESFQIMYNEYGIFTGYAYVTRTLETADDTNRYVAGATMTLFDAIEIFRMPDLTEDDRFAGVVVKRNGDGDVTDVYVRKGYAGTKIEYVKEKTDPEKISMDADTDDHRHANLDNQVLIDDNYTYQDEINEKGEATWIAKTIQREDTPILFYSLSDLRITSNDLYYSNGGMNDSEIDRVFGAERLDPDHNLYGFDREGNVVNVTQKDELDFSLFAFKDGEREPVFEIVGGDYNEVRYNGTSNKKIEVGEGTIVYHLDADGNRDAMVDPQTGIAYIEEDEKGPGAWFGGINLGADADTRIYVWPVNIYYDGSGSDVTAGSRTYEKIKTNRIATINADTANEYTIGTYTGDDFIKSVNPTIDQHGMTQYYQRSDETYVKGADRFDRDGDYLGYGYTDELDNDNLNAYTTKNHDNLYNGDKDDPFNQSTHYQYFSKQRIVVEVDMDGNYIVNGKDVVPVPERYNEEGEELVFSGWLIEPNKLTDGVSVKASWAQPGGSMSERQKNWYYSDKEATGTTVKMTVEFDANGGQFVEGSGDIHSSDNPLYFRQGESHLIENTWVTGENTPNDPFDTQIVHTIDQTSTTANDPYTKDANDPNIGGMADMLKRVPAGHYIMEEVQAPEGYVKGLPVGVTVDESTEIQTAEMVDTTIKIQIVKIDATDNYYYDIYKDGNLLKMPSGDHIKSKEHVGSFAYENVKGATIALKAAGSNQKAFNDWIKATNHPNITKVEDGENWYITFQSDHLVYLEGIPKGVYKLSEVVTPDGYVTANEMTINVDETTELVTYFMNDDHTKVEIEKFYNDGKRDTILPNQFKAGLQLQDENGEVIDSWYTDDLLDYTSVIDIRSGLGTTTSGFIENYERTVNDNKDIPTKLSWMVNRTATMRAQTDTTESWEVSDGSSFTIENGFIPEEAPEGFADAYKARNMDAEKEKFTYTIEMSATRQDSNDMRDQLWKTNTGKQIHISVYPANDVDAGGRQGYLFEYKFNYKDDYPAPYENLVSYDIASASENLMEVRHRFDYLKPGVAYKIHEFDVPNGFVLADDVTAYVEPTADVQVFSMENVQKELVIAKVAMDDKTGMFAGTVEGNVITGAKGVVIKGAKLALYKVDAFKPEYMDSFKKGEIPADAEKIEEWTSGEDGQYTARDQQREQIPKGYKVGDYKPHIIQNIENGYYYLIEEKTPDYYKTADPMELEISDKTTASSISDVQVVNKEMMGEIVVKKVNEQGSPLSGAYFLVKNKTLGTEVGGFPVMDGEGRYTIQDIGYFDVDGSLIPYEFTIQETSAPAGYKLVPDIHSFKFRPEDHGTVAMAINPSDSELVDGVLTVVNDETAITIGKTDYEDGSGVPDVRLKVYEAEFDGKEWKSTSTSRDDWEWTTGPNNYTHSFDGLEGGKCYVLRELEAPSGYTLADDMFFKISDDGGRIEKIWYDKTENPYIKFNSDSTGAIESVELSTRKITGTYVVLEDTETGTQKEYGTLYDGLVLTEKDVTDGKVYRVTEYVMYSDKSEETIGTTTFVARLKNGSMFVNTRYGVSMETAVEDQNGNEIVAFNPDGTTKTITNTLLEETQGLFVSGNGEDHETINTASSNSSVVTYTVKVDKAGSKVSWIPDGQTRALRTQPEVTAEDGVYQWTTTQDNEEIRFAAILKDDAVGYVNQKVTIDDKTYTYMNPIAFNYGENLYRDTSKLVVFNEIKGTDPRNETYEFTYNITLTKEDGSPLDGSYYYRTKNGDSQIFEAYGVKTTITTRLVGNDFVVISNLPYGTKYSVRIVDPSDDGFSVRNGVADSKTSKNDVSNVLFTNMRNVSADRELFEKNHSYQIVENTILNDETDFASAKYGFSISETCEVVGFDMKNKATQIEILKVDPDSNNLAGSRLAIYTEGKAKQIEQWVSDGNPHTMKHVLEPGQSYVLEEIEPTKGYWRAKDIPFTVSEDGTVDKIIMLNEKTRIKFKKTDFIDKEEVPGAHVQIKDKDGNIVDEWTSTTEDHIIEGELVAGETYYYHEDGAPNGYYYSEDVTFTVPEDLEDVIEGENDLVHMIDAETDVRITKVDAISREPVIGAVLQVRDKDGNVKDTWISEEEPHQIYKVLNAETTYYLHEVKAPDGYYKTATDVEFTLPKLPPVNETAGVIWVEMEDTKTKIRFKKTDFIDKEEVPGAHVQIKDKDGNVVDEWTSTTEDHYIEGELVAGETYYYHEDGAPNGYYYSEDVTFTVPENIEDVIEGENDLVHMIDAETDVRITKVNEKNEQVAGAILEVWDKDGNVMDHWVSDGKTPHQIYKVLNAETTYYLHEITPPNGFYRSEPVEFTLPKLPPVNETAGVIWVQMKDVETKIHFKKTDFIDKDEVPGAHVQVRDQHGNIVDEWTSTTEDHIIQGELIAGETYYYHEDGAPNGYYYSEDVTFTVPENLNDVIEGKNDLVNMIDAATDVRITKVDADNGMVVTGARLQVLDLEGNVMDEWTSEEQPHQIYGVLNAETTYVLHEVKAPDGYYKTATDVAFTLPKLPPVNETAGVIWVRMKDTKTKIRFKKTDFIDKEEVPGAFVQIKDKDGNVVDEWISTTEDHYLEGKLVAGETYYYHEEAAPNGYFYSEDVTFTVPENIEDVIEGKNDLVHMIDAPTHVEFKKTDATSEKEVPGSHVQIKDATGKVVHEWTSTTEVHPLDGVINVEEVYVMHEEGAPHGYAYATDIEFYLDRDRTVWVHNPETNQWEKREDSLVEMYDDALQLEVMKVERGTSTMIGGATLRILDSTGRVCEEWVTKAGEKHVIIEKFSDGTPLSADEVYTLVEVSAPQGYTKAAAKTFSVNRFGGVTTITMEDPRVDKPWEPSKPVTPDEPDNPDKPTEPEKTTPTVELDQLTFDKYNGSYGSGNVSITNNRKLAGAEYTIYNSDSSVYRTVTTGEDGTVSIPIPPAGTYFFKETKAPEGFMIDKETYSFTVAENKTVTGNLSITDYKKPEVEISKADSETKELLAGAEFKILDSDGNVVYQGTTESDGKLVFTAEFADTYTIVEVKAPDGYTLNTTYAKFTVSETGSVSGTTTIYNEKEGTKVGRITANYSSDYDRNDTFNSQDYKNLTDEGVPSGFLGFGHNKVVIDRYGNVVLPKSGDAFNVTLIVTIWISSMALIFIVLMKRKKNRPKE